MKRRHATAPFTLFAFQDIITSVTGILILIMLILCLTLLDRDDQPTEQSAPVDYEQVEAELAVQSAELQRLQAQLAALEKTTQMAVASTPEELREAILAKTNHSEQLKRRILEAQQDQKDLLQDLADQEAKAQKQAPLRALSQRMKEEIEDLEAELEELRTTNRQAYSFRDADNTTAWIVDVGEQEFLVAPVGKQTKPQVFSDRSLANRVKKFTDWASGLNPKTNYFVLVVRPKSVQGYRLIRQQLEPEGFEFGVDLIGDDVTIIDRVKGASL